MDRLVINDERCYKRVEVILFKIVFSSAAIASDVVLSLLSVGN